MRKRDERITTHNAIVSWLCAEDDYGVYLDFKENDDFSLEFDRSFDECQWAYSEFTLNMECEEGFCRPSFEEWLMLDLPDDTSDCLGCEGCELSMHEEDGPYDRFAPRMNNREAIAYAQSIF